MKCHRNISTSIKKKNFSKTRIMNEQTNMLVSRNIANRQLSAAAQRLNRPTKQPDDQIISTKSKESDVKSHIVIPTQKTSWNSKGV